MKVLPCVLVLGVYLGPQLVLSRVVQVHVLHRHGDRTPLTPNSLPNDHVNWYNLLGLAGGQLTGRGMNQALSLGQYLAAQYVGSGKLLDVAFENQHFELWSTTVDRTLMSAQALMLGMYRGPTKSNFDDVAQKNFLDGVQPVPIRTVPFYDDILQACDICPAFEDKKALLYNSELWLDKVNQTSELLLQLERATGLKNITLYNIYNVWDELFCQKAHGLLANAELLAMFDSVNGLADWTTYQQIKAGGKLVGAPLIAKIVAAMAATVEAGGQDEPKFYEYSAHDSTFMSLALALDLDDPNVTSAAHAAMFARIPAYASALIFELSYHSDTRAYAVGLVLRDGVTGQVTVVYNATWPAFQDFAKARAFSSDAEWCVACDNLRYGENAAATCIRALVPHGAGWDSYAPTAAPVPVTALPSVATVAPSLATVAPSMPPSGPVRIFEYLTIGLGSLAAVLSLGMVGLVSMIRRPRRNATITHEHPDVSRSRSQKEPLLHQI